MSVRDIEERENTTHEIKVHRWHADSKWNIFICENHIELSCNIIKINELIENYKPCAQQANVKCRLMKGWLMQSSPSLRMTRPSTTSRGAPVCCLIKSRLAATLITARWVKGLPTDELLCSRIRIYRSARCTPSRMPVVFCKQRNLLKEQHIAFYMRDSTSPFFTLMWPNYFSENCWADVAHFIFCRDTISRGHSLYVFIVFIAMYLLPASFRPLLLAANVQRVLYKCALTAVV